MWPDGGKTFLYFLSKIGHGIVPDGISNQDGGNDQAFDSSRDDNYGFKANLVTFSGLISWDH
jgi:hypothetical protein